MHQPNQRPKFHSLLVCNFFARKKSTEFQEVESLPRWKQVYTHGSRSPVTVTVSRENGRQDGNPTEDPIRGCHRVTLRSL